MQEQRAPGFQKINVDLGMAAEAVGPGIDSKRDAIAQRHRDARQHAERNCLAAQRNARLVRRGFGVALCCSP